jgi:transcriptional regulator with XRE-family HTH domain
VTPVPAQAQVIAARLCEAREFAGLGVAAIATAAGATADQLISWERGWTQPGDGQLARLAGVYRRPAEWFLGQDSMFLPGARLEARLAAISDPARRERAVAVAHWLQDAGPEAVSVLRMAG